MKPEAQRIAIAEACGFPVRRWLKDDPQDTAMVETMNLLPEYLNDLNAMHEAETYFDDKTADTRSLWIDYLSAIVGWPKSKTPEDAKFECQYRVARATASQRAEAFIRAIGKWMEDEQ